LSDLEQNMSIPAWLKPVIPFIKRASELERVPNIAGAQVAVYYLKLHALSTALTLPDRSDSDPYLLGMMEDLEKRKKPTSSESEAFTIFKDYADDIFQNVDTADACGNATMETAQGFYMVSTFYETLVGVFSKELGDTVNTMKDKVYYCKQRAAQINRDIKSGRQPTPPGGDPSVPTFAVNDPLVPPVPPVAAAPSYPVVGQSANNINNDPASAPVSVSTPVTGMGMGIAAPKSPIASFDAMMAAQRTELPSNVQDAIEFVSFAIANMKRNEIREAKDNLCKGLKHLE
jgi:hypothetical protein